MHNERILFILRERLDSYGVTIGLKNSIDFTCLALREKGYNADWRFVIDGNGVDKEVHCHRPRLVVIEALWLQPKKLEELMRLHKHTKWLIRLHSKIPFLSGEGSAIEMIRGYLALPYQERITVSFNNQEANNDFQLALGIPFTFLPNLYNKPDYATPGWHPDGRLHIGCFGAFRPLKNQLIQAMASLIVANQMHIKLHYHVNSTRIEQKGEAILKNIISLFEGSGHELILHGWLSHPDFLKLIPKMDVGLQVSYSESFNIVAADFVYSRIPIVVSQEIDWLPSVCQVKNPNSMLDIADKIEYVLNNRNLTVENSAKGLLKYNKVGFKNWQAFLSKEL